MKNLKYKSYATAMGLVTIGSLLGVSVANAQSTPAPCFVDGYYYTPGEQNQTANCPKPHLRQVLSNRDSSYTRPDAPINSMMTCPRDTNALYRPGHLLEDCPKPPARQPRWPRNKSNYDSDLSMFKIPGNMSVDIQVISGDIFSKSSSASPGTYNPFLECPYVNYTYTAGHPEDCPKPRLGQILLPRRSSDYVRPDVPLGDTKTCPRQSGTVYRPGHMLEDCPKTNKPPREPRKPTNPGPCAIEYGGPCNGNRSLNRGVTFKVTNTSDVPMVPVVNIYSDADPGKPVATVTFPSAKANSPFVLMPDQSAIAQWVDDGLMKQTKPPRAMESPSAPPVLLPDMEVNGNYIGGGYTGGGYTGGGASGGARGGSGGGSSGGNTSSIASTVEIAERTVQCQRMSGSQQDACINDLIKICYDKGKVEPIVCSTMIPELIRNMPQPKFSYTAKVTDAFGRVWGETTFKVKPMESPSAPPVLLPDTEVNGNYTGGGYTGGGIGGFGGGSSGGVRGGGAVVPM